MAVQGKSEPVQGNRPGGRTRRAFDIRLVIAMLFGIYGFVLTGVGLVSTSEEISKAAGLNINLWSGIGMVIVAGTFACWARLRPIIAPEKADPDR